MKHWILGFLTALLAVSCTASEQSYTPSDQNYTPAFDPSQFKGPQEGIQNQVLVLGTAHLSNMPETFKTDTLTPLMDRLATWAPHIITIENLSGPQCHYMRAYPDRYKESVEYYCWDPAPAQAATGLDIPAATAEITKVLASWPDNPTAAQRRKLASLFLANADRASALVQWLRLPESERHMGDGLDDTLVRELNKVRDRRSESYSIAAHLAARLGLERVHPIDDHTADFPSPDPKAYGDAIAKAWDNPTTDKRIETSKTLEANLDKPGGVLEMYRSYNDPKSGPLAFKSDFGAALEEPSPQGFGRSYVTYWETRNLRMAGNIRDILAYAPGSRTLVIVGASHKPYLESYLNQMHDMRIVDAEKVLH